MTYRGCYDKKNKKCEEVVSLFLLDNYALEKI